MPLVLSASLVWAVGTALGLSGWPLGPTALILGVVAGAWLLAARARSREAQDRSVVAWALLAAAAVAVGADARAGDARCLSEARGASDWRLLLLREAAPAGFAVGQLDAPGCRVRVAVAVRSGAAPAGSLIRVTPAEPTMGERGLLLRDGRVTLVRGPNPLWRWRNHVAAGIDRRFGEDAGLARALLIADTRGLSQELKARYADAGLVHILSISGLHVGIIGGALLLLVEALRLPATLGRMGAVGLVLLYVAAIGAPAAAVRSAALFLATTVSQLLQRPTSPWATYAIAAVLPLYDPRTVLDLGWQLSVSGYAGLLAAGRAAARLHPDLSGWRRSVAKELWTGAFTTAVTAPMLAWHFGRLSMAGIVSNLAAGPVVSLLQPTLFLAMLVPGDAIGRFVADAARPPLRALDAVAAAAAMLPGAAIVVAPPLAAVCIAAVGATALIAAPWARHWVPWAVLAASSVAWMAWVPTPRLGASGQLEVHMLDVGQGDAIALRLPRGDWVLVDVGRSWSGGDAGRQTVIPYLQRRGGAVALLVFTHPHADHVGGAASVITALRPRAIRDAAFVGTSPTYVDALRAAARTGTPWQRVRPGERLTLDGVAFEFLAPDSAWTVALDDPNEASTVLRVQYGARSVLLTGDAEVGLEGWLLERVPARLDVDVLKVGHHGSRTSSTQAFVDAVSPRVALVSVGTDNTYALPNAEIMWRYLEAGATVLRTDQLGTVVVRTDGESLEVEAAGTRWSALRPLPAPP